MPWLQILLAVLQSELPGHELVSPRTVEITG